MEEGGLYCGYSCSRFAYFSEYGPTCSGFKPVTLGSKCCMDIKPDDVRPAKNSRLEQTTNIFSISIARAVMLLRDKLTYSHEYLRTA